MEFLVTFEEFLAVTEDFPDYPRTDFSTGFKTINGACISEKTISDLKEFHGMTDEDIENIVNEAIKESNLEEWNGIPDDI